MAKVFAIPLFRYSILHFTQMPNVHRLKKAPHSVGINDYAGSLAMR